MMKNFLALFQKGKRPDTEAKDEVAKLLQTNPEALSQFESAYKQLALDVEQEGTFSTNSRQAAEKAHTIPGEAGQNPYTEDEMSTAEDRTDRPGAVGSDHGLFLRWGSDPEGHPSPAGVAGWGQGDHQRSHQGPAYTVTPPTDRISSL